MVLTGVLFVLFLGVIATTFVLGAFAWLTARSRQQPPWGYADPLHRSAAEASLARHPAGRDRTADVRGWAKGPDDDVDFLRHLDRIIRANPGGNPPVPPQR
jgi:hypothetical protein